MIRRWFRVVVPEESLATFLLFVVAGEAVHALRGDLDAYEAIVRVVALMYGVYRVFAFHPVFRPAYAKWLETTPWTSNKPLPLGPVHLVAQDAIIMLMATVLEIRFPSIARGAIPMLILFGYLATLCLSLLLTSQRPYGYVLCFGLGLIVRCWQLSMAVVAVIAVVLCALGWIGLRLSLAGFPWCDDAWFAFYKKDSRSSYEKKDGTRDENIGWPFEILKPVEEHAGPAAVDRIVLCLLAGWWTYAIFSVLRAQMRNPNEIVFLDLMWIVCGVATCVVIRFFIYRKGCAPPISIPGRFATGRLIIPGHDKVYLTPFATIVAAVIGYDMVQISAPQPEIHECVLGMTTAVILMISALGGPRLRLWKLTGRHRISPGSAVVGLLEKL